MLIMGLLSFFGVYAERAQRICWVHISHRQLVTQQVPYSDVRITVMYSSYTCRDAVSGVNIQIRVSTPAKCFYVLSSTYPVD
jgi:hypothetical protein